MQKNIDLPTISDGSGNKLQLETADSHVYEIYIDQDAMGKMQFLSIKTVITLKN